MCRRHFFILFIYNENKTSAMKMPWIILIMIFPFLGVSLYLFIGMSYSTRAMKKRFEEVDSRLFPLLPENKEVADRLASKDRRAANIARYLHDRSGYPVYDNTDIVYYDDAAKGLEAQKEELKKAEKFIFMEYHAIENKESWQGIQEILEEKVKAGVDVRVFNPFKLGANLFLNNRDHRKDIPNDEEQVGEDVYISISEYAEKYVWFVTPYLILTDEMIHALGLAAKRGVDVRIITPGVPDKKLVYAVTRSYYRSLYHHFENGCLFIGYEAVAKVREDFEEMLSVSREVGQDYLGPRPKKRILLDFLRLFAPLL